MYRKYAALADEYYREGVQRDEVKEENRLRIWERNKEIFHTFAV